MLSILDILLVQFPSKLGVSFQECWILGVDTLEGAHIDVFYNSDKGLFLDLVEFNDISLQEKGVF